MFEFLKWAIIIVIMASPIIALILTAKVAKETNLYDNK